MYKSFKAFIEAVLRKWGWLVTGVVGGSVFILNLLGINPSMSRIIGVIILGGCLLVAWFLAYHELYIVMENIKLHPTAELVLTKPKTKKILSSSHRAALHDIEEQMETIHGHSDPYGLEADLRDGVLVSALITRNCTRCGKPRNQKGEFVL